MCTTAHGGPSTNLELRKWDILNHVWQAGLLVRGLAGVGCNCCHHPSGIQHRGAGIGRVIPSPGRSNDWELQFSLRKLGRGGC